MLVTLFEPGVSSPFGSNVQNCHQCWGMCETGSWCPGIGLPESRAVAAHLPNQSGRATAVVIYMAPFI